VGLRGAIDSEGEVDGAGRARGQAEFEGRLAVSGKVKGERAKALPGFGSDQRSRKPGLNDVEPIREGGRDRCPGI
jgi:hypothetical protein